MSDDGRPAGLELRLFGGPVLVGPEGPVALSPTQSAFLTVVFAEERITRPRVARVLWRCEDGPRSRHRIRQLLHLVNGRLGTRAVRTEGDVLLAGPDLPSDIAGFRAASRSGRLQEAGALLAKGFAKDKLPRVGGEYRDWAEAFEKRLTRRTLEAAASAWRDASQAGQWSRARDAAECLYLIQPDDEPAVRRVIEARGRAGRIGSAEAAYASYRAAMPAGETPAPSIEEAIERVRLVGERAKKDRPEARAPFVGRTEALAEGRSALDRAVEGAFSFFLVIGESGIGKTRLLEELEREAILRGFRCLRASPTELERRIPLNPLFDALRDLDLRPHLEALGKPWSTVISSSLPPGLYDELAGELPPIQEGRLSRRLLDAYSLLLERLARERPTVLLLDDLHWADATTVAALQFLQRRWTQGSFGIVASVRPQLVQGDDPVSKYLSGEDGLEVRRTELGELTKEEAVELVRGVSRGEIDQEASRRLCELAGLHPLYLTELTRDLLAGRLELKELPPGEVTIPVSLQQILRSRIATLSDPAGRIAGILAVHGRPLRLAGIASLSGLTLDDCAEHVDDLERRGLVGVRRDEVRITHDLFRSALYNDLPKARRAVLHRALAEHLLAGSPAPAAGELAIHFARAGDSSQAARFGWAAATAAWEAGAMAEAAYFFELVAENDQGPAQRAAATGKLARALYLHRDLTRANPVLQLAAERLREAGDPNQARRLDIHRIEGLAAAGSVAVPDLIERVATLKSDARTAGDWEAVALALNAELRLLNRLGTLDRVDQVFDEMREAARHGTAAEVLSNAGLAMQVMFGDPEEGLACAYRAVEMAEKGSDHRLIALSRLLIGLQYQGLILLPSAEALIAEARTLAERSGDRWEHFGIEGNFALALLDAGDVDRAAVHMDKAARALGSSNFDIPQFNLSNNRAELALAQHDFDEAALCFRRAEESIEVNTPKYAFELAQAGLGFCALQTGDLSEARRREQQMAPAPDRWTYDPTTILTFRARLLERRGNRPSAITLLEQSVDKLARRHIPAWLKVSLLLTRLKIKEGRLQEAATEARICETLARELNLTIRAEEFARLSSRCGVGD